MSEKYNSQKHTSDKSKASRPSGDKPKSGRNSGAAKSRPEPSRAEKRGEKPRTDKPRSDKPRSDKPRSDKPRSDAGRSDSRSESRIDNSRIEKARSGKPGRPEHARGEKPRTLKPRGTKPKAEALFDENGDEEEVKYQKPKNALDSTEGQSEKLQKVLARAGHGSRREVEAMIQAGRVSVDGKISTLGDRVEVTGGTKIRLDGHVLSVMESQDTVCRVLAYYKPEGELCTRNDPEGRPTVFDRLPKMRGSRWIAVGRLDVNTSGLLLFTTDGELANRLMHPSREVEREYAVRVFGQVDDEKIKQLSRGVQLEDGPAAFRSIKFQGGEGLNQWYNVTLTEGRNREVRRLWEAVGVQVSRLIRVRYGDLNLPKGLPRGGYKELDLPDINYLRTLVDMTEETVSKLPVERDRRRVKANQIRRAVKRHTQVAPTRRTTGPAKRG
ncbi:23S rRNA pseudouridine(2605) synthase RluB [Rahnella aquatilis]|jgi:23S rRNA pseudouridine2605 synthase|uniref:Pseudouridine synthase n=1 Tax=Rahnella sp. (strain Y9602) TaxID=2703885 RepID=A0A0H3FAS9_RAHSY|nr:pseudouridine synthase [Rahnella aceris]AFE58826.1 23S rRNA pseudouridylate synthase B [Rahnella aquatilis HX2]AYA07469.1 23S rRNA pseudouridine(2605) synthase RluB [Rahnella aquatilis]MCM2444967.1 23S rRNA pseudouridine(2605) synthase RluB [Rahnella sp. CG8]MQB53736.1 23S rRNA pseudouridine(2605) synthase RluB [Rahnella sp. RcJ3]